MDQRRDAPTNERSAGLWTRVLFEGQAEDEALKGTPDEGKKSGWDVVRNRYLASLEERTGRPAIAYATAFLDVSSPKSSTDIAIHAGDKAGFLEVTRELSPGPLDVLLHSPGGSAEGAEGIVRLLRARFDDIRFIVPIAAKSAATMLALSGAAVVMDEASELGPIDPQRQWRRQIGAASELVVSPVWAMQQLWKRIDTETRQDPASLPKWYPIISQFGPSLLIECDTAMALARTLVGDWLRTGMFKTRANPEGAAGTVVEALADHGRWMSHSRMIGIEDVIALDIEVVDLRQPANAGLADQIALAWNAVSLTLNNTGAVKVFANSRGTSVITVVQQMISIGGGGADGSRGATAPPRSPAAGTIIPRSARRRRKA